MFYVFYELAFVARKHANALGKDVGRAFTVCGVLTLVVWMGYPIAWGVAEGGNVISSDSEAVFYGVLDFLAKPCFSAALIYSHWNISPARMGLSIREYGSVTDKVRSEKSPNDYSRDQPRDQNVPTNGTSTSIPVISQQGYHAPTSETHSSHMDHRTGYTPVHEGVTREGAPHTSTV